MNMNHQTNATQRQDIISVVRSSGAFDENYYKLQAADLGLSPENVIEHYLTEGWLKGLNPHPCFDTRFYVQHNEDLRNNKLHPFIHFIIHGYKEHRRTRTDFSLTEYKLRHPEIDLMEINPLKHFTVHYGTGESYFSPPGESDSSKNILDYNVNLILAEAKKLKLFDYEWYKKTYNPEFISEIDAFQDYLHKSKFSPVNPSPHFDTETYHRNNLDVYHAQISPLFHYLISGKREGRLKSDAVSRWLPQDRIDIPMKLTKTAAEQKIAICLHIYYEDYIDKFAAALTTFPAQFDLFITLANASHKSYANKTFKKIKNLRKLKTKCVPNKGRNFGPLLVEFSQDLLKYDLFCHLHSKKSLYSGREQTQWADYLTEYLLNDCAVVRRVLNAFASDSTLGLYYPTTFWMMPSWVNHVTMNKSYMREWQNQIAFDCPDGFLTYPAGGMFWARPQALIDILSLDYGYDDFPSEPLPNDGSKLHALERILGPVAQKNGFKQFFHHPASGHFTVDEGFITSGYKRTIDSLLADLRTFSHITFDVFDTLVRREFTEPDYAKFLLGEELTASGAVASAADFVRLRNHTEYQLRANKNFQGDVCIIDVYEELIKHLPEARFDPYALMTREFDLDLSLITAKDEMVDVFNTLGSIGHILWVISDTYYTRDQIALILKKAGVSAPHRLLISSAEQKRKDNGTMWALVKDDLAREGVSAHIHVGDNVVADCQIPGDRGISSIHILHPVDKWQALGFPEYKHTSDSFDANSILKWGKLVSVVGRVPFL
ncbi:glycosyl transferase family 1 [Pseudomonas sp. S36]|nr:glycosyl transferase family 1 [Pseudomonas sp. S36]